MKRTHFLPFVAVLLFFAEKASAQVPTPQDCLGAIPILPEHLHHSKFLSRVGQLSRRNVSRNLSHR